MHETASERVHHTSSARATKGEEVTSDTDEGAEDLEQQTRASNVLILPASVERDLAETDGSLGALGRPFDHRTPFYIGLTGALGVAVAYVLARGIADVTTVLVLIGLALFIAIGLNPILDFLTSRGLARSLAVAIV